MVAPLPYSYGGLCGMRGCCPFSWRAESVRSPEIAQRWAADGTTPVGSTHEQFSAHMRSEVDKWRKLVKDMGLALR